MMNIFGAFSKFSLVFVICNFCTYIESAILTFREYSRISYTSKCKGKMGNISCTIEAIYKILLYTIRYYMYVTFKSLNYPAISLFGLLLVFLCLYVLLDFLHFIVQYNYENCVWHGLELGASLTLQWVNGPPLVIGG